MTGGYKDEDNAAISTQVTATPQITGNIITVTNPDKTPTQ